LDHAAVNFEKGTEDMSSFVVLMTFIFAGIHFLMLLGICIFMTTWYLSKLNSQYSRISFITGTIDIEMIQRNARMKDVFIGEKFFYID